MRRHHNHMRSHPQVMKQLFCYTGSELTATAMQDIMQYQFSLDGSNAREAEEATAMFFVHFLQDCEGEYVPCSTAVVSHI